MVIEVVKWPKAKKSHAINQDAPTFTLCGVWIPQNAEKDDRVQDAEMPTCFRCALSVMKS